MRLLVRGGTVVTAAGLEEVDVLAEDGVITALHARGSSVQADETVDASGKLVFPGFIDPHVHSRDPGNTHKETFDHSTLGALCGGVTTILEMPNAVPAVSTAEIFAERRAHHEKSAWVDFGLWGLALGDANAAEIPKMFDAGAIGVKFFWGYALDRETKGLVYNFAAARPEDVLLPPEHGEVLEMFANVAKTGGLLAAHCEDRHILASSAEALGGPIKTYDDLLAARPAIAEATTIAIGAQFARATGCRFHVVHMASAAGEAAVRQAQAAGAPVTAETCPQYLTLTADNAEELGPLIKVYPPVRHQPDQDALWRAITDGTISSVGSDHAPHTVSEKMVGFEDAPAGGLGVETIAPLMVDAMVNGKITPERLAQVLSSETAALYGISHRKGRIALGNDADMTLVDPNATHVIRNEDMHALNPTTTWNGWKLGGKITASIIRGSVAMVDGAPVGDRRGRFVGAQHKAPATALAGLESR